MGSNVRMQQQHGTVFAGAALVLALCALSSSTSLPEKADQLEKGVGSAEKKAFLELLKTLPTRGEFFTEESVQRAAPHTHVLLALTVQDIGKHDIYPFLALSRGLLDRKALREYGARNFPRIAHPTIKLFWAAVLFDEKPATAEIARFLRAALACKNQTDELSQMLGPDFEQFKKRVKEYKISEK